MLAKYITKDEIARQYQALFPEGHEKYYAGQKPFDFTDIVNAIENSSKDDAKKALELELPNDTALWGALEQFRANFTERSQQERVFNLQHLIKAFELYKNKFDSWDWSQRDLFWRQVIGYIQRFLPANMAMAFVSDLSDIVKYQKKAQRSLQCKYYDEGAAFFPVTFDSLSGLGYQYAYIYHGLPISGIVGNAPAPGILTKLMSNKMSGLQNLCPPAPKAGIELYNLLK